MLCCDNAGNHWLVGSGGEEGHDAGGQAHGGDVVDGWGLARKQHEGAHDQAGKKQDVVVENAAKKPDMKYPKWLQTSILQILQPFWLKFQRSFKTKKIKMAFSP